MAETLLADIAVAHAVSGITARSERAPKVAVLQQTYVETGVLPQVNNYNNQILYGRRGTGKTHVLQVLGTEIEKNSGAYTIYADLRLLGSASVYMDPSRSVSDRCVAVFKDLLGLVQGRLMDIATDPIRSGAGVEEVSEFCDAVVQRSTDVQSREIRSSRTRTIDSGGDAKFAAGTRGIEFGASGKGATGSSDSEEVVFVEALRDSVVFAEVYQLMDKALVAMGISHLVLLIDEWTSLPTDMQPYVADFLKRSLFPSPRVTVKIASLEYRSNFSMAPQMGNPVGFELGPDISANIDLDDYYVYERNVTNVERIFQELLFKHVSSGLKGDVMAQYSVRDATQFRTRLFTERATFVELVRAGEGVVRDFLGIFNSAFFKARNAGSPKIDVRSVEDAARDWYETDKSASLSEPQQTALHKIIADVIGSRQTKMFMLKRENSGHPMILSLFDMRMIHLILRGYSDKKNPGLRYNIYALDYGTYVDLKRTKAEPESFKLFDVDFEEPVEDLGDRMVPFADKRSIRRVILDTSIFDGLD